MTQAPEACQHGVMYVRLQRSSEQLMNISHISLMKCWQWHWPLPFFLVKAVTSTAGSDLAQWGELCVLTDNLTLLLVLSTNFLVMPHHPYREPLVGSFWPCFQGCRAASHQAHWQWPGTYLREVMGGINQKVSKWQTYHRNCFPSYCRNWDPGFFQPGHVLYGTQTPKQPFLLDLPNKCRKNFPTMPNLSVNNQVSTVKQLVQNERLVTIAHNMAIIWGGLQNFIRLMTVSTSK